MGTPVQHLYLPREGEGTSTARPTPAATRDDDRGVWVFTEKNGARHKKLPWPTTPPKDRAAVIANALKLMEEYASWIMSSGEVDQQLLNLSVRHIQDLLALTIGPTADFADTARTRGLRAARLKLAKAFIVSHCHRRDLSVGSVAASLNVTPRYVQRLFEADGTTFSEFLTGQRLARAHRLLCEPSSSPTAISTIAYDVGFGDLSYFNRRFRRQFGLTPREVRGDKV